MTVKPWAKAIATIPGGPTPSPITAAAPAPMKINAKVPMNSARSLGAIRLDIVDSRDEINRSARSGCAKGQYVGWGAADGAGRRRRPAKRAGLLRGEHRRAAQLPRIALREPHECVGDALAVSRVRLRAVGHMPLLDVLGGLADLAGRVVEQHLLLLRIHLPEQIARLLPVIVIHPVSQC